MFRTDYMIAEISRCSKTEFEAWMKTGLSFNVLFPFLNQFRLFLKDLTNPKLGALCLNYEIKN